MEREEACRSMERRSGLQSLTFSRSLNLYGLYFIYFPNPFRPKVLLFYKQNYLGDLTTISPTFHLGKLRAENYAPQTVGRGPPAVTMCLILDIDSQLPGLSSTKGSSYLQQWLSSCPLSLPQLCSLLRPPAHLDFLGKQKLPSHFLSSWGRAVVGTG